MEAQIVEHQSHLIMRPLLSEMVQKLFELHLVDGLLKGLKVLDTIFSRCRHNASSWRIADLLHVDLDIGVLQGPGTLQHCALGQHEFIQLHDPSSTLVCHLDSLPQFRYLHEDVHLLLLGRQLGLTNGFLPHNVLSIETPELMQRNFAIRISATEQLDSFFE